MITGYNKTGDFFALLRACLLVGYVEFARNIRQKWKGYFVACEQALCLRKKIARKGKFPARPKACSQARYFVSREALVARQFWKVLSPPTLPRPISIPLSSFVSSRLQPRRHGSIDPIFRKVEERQAQSMPRWTGMNSSVTYAHGRRICPLFVFEVENNNFQRPNGTARRVCCRWIQCKREWWLLFISFEFCRSRQLYAHGTRRL